MKKGKTMSIRVPGGSIGNNWEQVFVEDNKERAAIRAKAEHNHKMAKAYGAITRRLYYELYENRMKEAKMRGLEKGWEVRE